MRNLLFTLSHSKLELPVIAPLLENINWVLLTVVVAVNTGVVVGLVTVKSKPLPSVAENDVTPVNPPPPEMLCAYALVASISVSADIVPVEVIVPPVIRVAALVATLVTET